MLDAVLSDLYGLSAVLNVVTAPAPSVLPGCRSDRMPAEPVLGRVQAVLEARRLRVGLRPDRLQRAGRGDAPRHPGRQPPLHDRLVVVGELAVVGQQLEHRHGVAQVPLGEVVLLRADDRGGDEVAVARRRLLHQLAAEQLADQRLEDHVRGEDRLAPVVDPGQRLRDLADALPGRVARSRSRGARCRRSRRSPRSGSGCTAPGPGRTGSGACCSPRSRCCACWSGARRLALAYRYSPRPWSTCIHAPTLRSTKRTQFRLHCSNALVCLAASMFWLSCRTTLAL